MRYLSKPNSILRAFENTVSVVIWVVLALQMTGVLPEFINSLDAVTFKIGSPKPFFINDGSSHYCNIFVYFNCDDN